MLENKIINLIVACSLNKIIGKNNQLPWHLPADLQFFKRNTINKTIIMGKKTFLSIGRPLPSRQNIILSQDKDFARHHPEIKTCHDLSSSVLSAHHDIFVIGGSQAYQSFLPFADNIYLTEIQADIRGDSFFTFDKNLFKEQVLSIYPKDDQNQYDLIFKLYRKI